MNQFFRDVVVTGLGAVSPFGGGVDVLWPRMLSARGGAASIGLRRLANSIRSFIPCAMPPRSKRFRLPNN